MVEAIWKIFVASGLNGIRYYKILHTYTLTSRFRRICEMYIFILVTNIFYANMNTNNQVNQETIESHCSSRFAKYLSVYGWLKIEF